MQERAYGVLYNEAWNLGPLIKTLATCKFPIMDEDHLLIIIWPKLVITVVQCIEGYINVYMDLSYVFTPV